MLRNFIALIEKNELLRLKPVHHSYVCQHSYYAFVLIKLIDV